MKKVRETTTVYSTNEMLTVSLPEMVVKDLTEIAKLEGLTVEQALSKAAAYYRREVGRRKIDVEAEAYRRKHPRLRAKYLGKHIAMHNGRVVDHDRDPSALYLRVRERFGRIPVLIRLVEEEPERELVFRSPRLEPIK